MLIETRPMTCSRRCWKLTVLATAVVTTSVAAFLIIPDSSVLAKDPLGRVWPQSQQVSMDAIDHSVYDRLLRKYVDDDGFVDYASWQRSTADRQSLRNYLDHLSRASLSAPASRQAQLAFWINAYNAVTLEGILQVYPTESIREHTSRLGGYNIWKHLPLLVGGRKHSLEQIEHDVLRKMGEPRIHFTIVCASVSCPRLRNEAYATATIEDQLDANARDFFNRPQNFRWDDEGTLHLSAILNWFGEDFGASIDDRLAYLRPYFPAEAPSSSRRIRYLDYDWALNDQAHKPSHIGTR